MFHLKTKRRLMSVAVASACGLMSMHAQAQQAEPSKTTEPGTSKKSNPDSEKIQEVHETGRPILIGTISVESSEHLANILRKKNIKFEILNAKNH